MFELFPDQPVSEFPTLINVAYAMIWAFVLAALIAITHKLTFKGKRYPSNFFQSLVLGAIVTSMVMMAIGDSLARGLGVFGAMAIIRFRTRIEDPRNVLFLFAALSVGLAIGVYGYTIAFVGTVIFCAVAFILHFSAFQMNGQKGKINFTLLNSEDLPAVLAVAHQFCSELHNINMTADSREDRKVVKYQYQFALASGKSKDELFERLQNETAVIQLRIAMDEDLN